MPQPRYEQIAAQLRDRIRSGEFEPGTRLPGIGKLARDYGTGAGVVQEAVNLLELDGLVVVRDRRGTFVLAPDAYRNHVDLGTAAQRNDLGYVFAKPMGHWPPVGTPSRAWVPCPADVADLLDLDEGAEVLARYRVVGPSGKPMQITTTYLPASLARGTVLAEADTGPGGWIDRIEQDMGRGPLEWLAEISTRLPTAEEAETLGISSRLPVLVTHRTHVDPDGQVVAVDVVVVDGRRMSVRVPIRRAESAQWPTTPAIARNSPLPVDETPRGMEGDQATDGSQGG